MNPLRVVRRQACPLDLQCVSEIPPSLDVVVEGLELGRLDQRWVVHDDLEISRPNELSAFIVLNEVRDHDLLKVPLEVSHRSGVGPVVNVPHQEPEQFVLLGVSTDVRHPAQSSYSV